MYKKITTLLFAIVFWSINTFAQTPTFAWAKQMGAASSDIGYTIAKDGANNVYVGGRFFGANASGIIYKLNPSGATLWSTQFSGAGSNCTVLSIKVDGSGNVYSTGYFSGTIDFDPGAGVFNMTYTGGTNQDIFITKLDASGNFLWAKQIGNNFPEIPYSLNLDATGNVFTTGLFYNTVDFDPGAGTFNLVSNSGSEDVFICKLDPSGNFVFAKNFGGSSSDDGYSITFDVSGNIYTIGRFNSTADFDPNVGVFNLTSAGSDDIYINKLDALGNFVWAKRIGSIGSDYGWAISTDASSNVYFTGKFNGIVDFDPNAGVFNLNSGSSQAAYVCKLDALGNFVFAKLIGGGSSLVEGLSISLDPSGSIYTTGYFSGTADFDPGAGSYTLSPIGTVDVYISKLNSSGNFAWATQIGSGGTQSFGQSVVIDGANSVLTTGYFNGLADFDPTIASFTMTPVGSADIFALKLGDCSIAPAQPLSIVGSNNVCLGTGASTYSIANVTGATSYTWSLPSGWSGSSTTNTISATTGTASGNISVAAVNACGTSSAAVLNVTVNPQPTITVNSGAICAGNSFTMSPSGASTYTYSSGTSVVSPTANATYSVSGTSTAGCVSASPAISNVTVNALPTISASTNNTLLCTGQSATLTASGASTYTWSPGGPGTNIVVSPTVSATYTINGTSSQGCNNSSTFTQSVSACTGIESNGLVMSSEVETYPNPFNTKITIVTSSVVDIQIFNTLGSLVYSEKLKEGKTEIDLSKESAGIYFIKVGNVTKRIIKQ